MPTLLDTPRPFAEALDHLAKKRVLTTALSSAEIREEFTAELRLRSLFSGRTTKAAILQEYQDQLGELLNGETNVATARMEIQNLFDALGYSPERGFRGDEDADIPPAERGTLRDLSSNRRVDLVLVTNMRQCANYGFWKQGQSDFALFAYPCYELIRIYPREVPRGMRLRQGALEHVRGEDWPSRWEAAGGTFYGMGRMIARKDDEIWGRLGSSDLFHDALDTFFPPFAFNSGYGWREIDRGESIRLGVIGEETQVEGQRHGLNDGLEAAAQFDEEFLRALRDELDLEIADGKARLAANAFDPALHPRSKKGRFVRSAIARDIKASRRALRVSLNQKRDIRTVIKRGSYRVDFEYGRPGTIKKGVHDDGYGTSHLQHQHADVLHQFPVTLARGSWHAHEDPNKVYVVHKNHIAVLEKQERTDGSRSHTRFGITTHLKNRKTAHEVLAKRTVLLEGR